MFPISGYFVPSEMHHSAARGCFNGGDDMAAVGGNNIGVFVEFL